jgi:signal peptidase I
MSKVVRLAVLGVAAAAVVRQLGRSAFLFVTVVGKSMEPTLDPGDRVIALRRRLARPLRVGDIVVLREDGRNLVKRVAAIGGMPVPQQTGLTVPVDSLWVLGDGRQSYDSRHFGAVDDADAVGLVLRRLWSDPRGR